VCKTTIPKLAEEVAEQKGESKASVRETLNTILEPYIEHGPEITFLQKERGKTYAEIVS